MGVLAHVLLGTPFDNILAKLLNHLLILLCRESPTDGFSA